MADADAFRSSLQGIAGRLAAEMSERDVENAFLDENFYTVLGYEGAGRDAEVKELEPIGFRSRPAWRSARTHRSVDERRRSRRDQ
jgi:hypothetical protein